MTERWKTVPLGEACEVIAGQSPAGSAYNSAGKGLPFYQGKKEFGDKFIGPPSTWTTEVTKKAITNDILMSVRAPVGPINFSTQEICIGRGLAAIRVKLGLDRHFLFYFLLSIQSQINGRDGAVFPSISLDEIREIELSFPSLPEQQRIVAILDVAFAGLATATAKAEKNLKNASELFESQLNAAFRRCGDNWTVCALADCLQYITYGFTNPMPTTDAGPFMVTAKNIVGGQIDYVTARHTSRDAFDNLITDKSRPKIGDVLLTKDGTLGRLAVVERADLCINQSVALLRPNGRMDPHFMRLLLSSRGYQDRMIADAGGATIKHIYITRVDKMDVAFPLSLVEQRRVVATLNDASGESKRLTNVYGRKLTALSQLKQSLLRKAFSGELTSPPSSVVSEAAE